MNFKKTIITVLIFSLCTFNAYGKSIELLKEKIQAELSNKNATVGVSILSGNLKESISINGDKKLPMQSVFKYHLGLAILNKVDQGDLNLDDEVTITKKDLDNNLWSPIRKKYPEGVVLSLSEVLKYTIASSDNVGCDVLFKIVGGTQVVEAYLHQHGILDLAIKYDEFTMQAVWERQYDNWTTADQAVLALRLFYENDGLLSNSSHRFLWDTMKGSNTGSKKIKEQLPKGTVVAHKTGFSGSNKEGLTAAHNDIGVVLLPNGQHFYISVLVSDSLESGSTNKKIISNISKYAWDYFINAEE